MYWNHRVVRMKDKGTGSKYYEVCEVFYDGDTSEITGIVDLGVSTWIEEEDSTGDELLDYQKAVSELMEILMTMYRDIKRAPYELLDEKTITKHTNATPVGLEIQDESLKPNLQIVQKET